MTWRIDETRAWWLLLRDVLLFALGVVVWINELLLSSEAPYPLSLVAGATAMALPFTLAQDRKP